LSASIATSPVAAAVPARRPIDVICLSSIDWDLNWQGHQQIMSALAPRGDNVRQRG
jgi:hypothetical protein